MQPAELDGSRINGNQVADGIIAHGAAVQYSADGKVKAAVTATTLSCGGIANNDNFENESNPGFYEDGDPVPIIVGGPARAWLIGGQATVFGDFLKLHTTLGAGTEGLGVFMKETTPTTRTAATRLKVFGTGAGNTDFAQITAANVASGAKTITMDATTMAALALSVGDYIIIDDDNGAEMNRVKTVGATSFTTQNAVVNAYTTAATGKVYKLTQIEVEQV